MGVLLRWSAAEVGMRCMGGRGGAWAGEEERTRCMGRRRVQPRWADGGAAEVHGQEENAAEVGRWGCC